MAFHDFFTLSSFLIPLVDDVVALPLAVVELLGGEGQHADAAAVVHNGVVDPVDPQLGGGQGQGHGEEQLELNKL